MASSMLSIKCSCRREERFPVHFIDLIEKATNRGVPLYNHGQPAACASVYEITARALLTLETDLPEAAAQPLRNALAKMQYSENYSEKAWTLRNGLDDAHAALTREMMTSL